MWCLSRSLLGLLFLILPLARLLLGRLFWMMRLPRLLLLVVLVFLLPC
jgi:hypothetical protein